ncbi:MAG: CIA30 family protein [Elusimicrobia bacterium]|nr:CIA30 family protein [Elusimicrobiota bacterium]
MNAHGYFIILYALLVSGCSSQVLIRANGAPMEYKSFPSLSSIMIDDMDDLGEWTSYVGTGVSVAVNRVSGRSGNAMEITYNFSTGKSFSVARDYLEDLSHYRGIRLVYRGEGNSNTMEIRFEDEKGTIYTSKLHYKTNPSSWITDELLFSGFTFSEGSVGNIDWSEIAMIDISVIYSKKDNDEGGYGKIVIDHMELVD